MKKVKFVRVDSRLVHGQILMKWLEIKQIDRVIIIDDDIKGNPFMKGIMRRSLPKKCSLEIWDCREAREFMEAGDEEVSAFILVRRVAALAFLDRSAVFHEINIASMPFSEGKEKIYEHVYADKEEQKYLRHFINTGTKVYIQMVPDSGRIWLRDVLEGRTL